jgi:hypothetical protein
VTCQPHAAGITRNGVLITLITCTWHLQHVIMGFLCLVAVGRVIPELAPLPGSWQLPDDILQGAPITAAFCPVVSCDKAFSWECFATRNTAAELMGIGM